MGGLPVWGHAMPNHDTFLDIADNQRRYLNDGKPWQDSKHVQVVSGHQAKYRRMRRKLSAFFRFTQEEGDYANNRNSKGRYVPAFITLTYPSNEAWRPDHITKFINLMRNHAARQWGLKLRYSWVAETTKNRVIHYHVIAWHPRKFRFPKPDQIGWWPHGHSKVEGVKKGVYSYMLKYISKGCQNLGLAVSAITASGRKQSARMFACGGLSQRSQELLYHQMLPQYVKQIFGPIPFGEKIRRVKGGWECGKLWVKGNFECMWSGLDHSMHCKFGVFWSPLPDEKEDMVIPF